MGRIRTKQLDPQETGGTEHTTQDAPTQSPDQDAVPPTNPGGPTYKLDLILKEIRDSRAAMEQQMGTLNTNINLLKAEHVKLADKVKFNKLALDDPVPQQTEHSSQLEQLLKQMKGLQHRVDDAEGRSNGYGNMWHRKASLNCIVWSGHIGSCPGHLDQGRRLGFSLHVS